MDPSRKIPSLYLTPACLQRSECMLTWLCYFLQDTSGEDVHSPTEGHVCLTARPPCCLIQMCGDIL